MDDLDLSELWILRFDPTSKDDYMKMMLVAMLSMSIVFFSWCPHTATFSTLLCFAQIHFGFVPQEHNYWNDFAMQAATTWILSTQLGEVSSTLAGYFRRKARDACFSTFKSLFVRPVSRAARVAICGCIVMYWSIFHFCRFAASATVRLVRARLVRALVAFKGDIDIPDEESDIDIPDEEIDHHTLGDFLCDSMYESESDPDFELECDSVLEYDSDISFDELQDLTNDSKDEVNAVNEIIKVNAMNAMNKASEANEANEANVDASTITSTLTADTTMTPSGVDHRSPDIRSGSQSSNVKRIADYCKKVSEESDTRRHCE
jgi:hypothetical protein